MNNILLKALNEEFLVGELLPRLISEGFYEVGDATAGVYCLLSLFVIVAYGVHQSTETDDAVFRLDCLEQMLKEVFGQ